MSEVFHQIRRGVGQINALATAPKRLTDMIEKFGLPDEKVRYTVYARYYNPQKWLDQPEGLILITNQRFLFVAIVPMMPPIPIINRPMIKGTDQIVCSLNSMELAEAVPFGRRGRRLQITINKIKYVFSVKYLIKIAKPMLVEEVVREIMQAKANLA